MAIFTRRALQKMLDENAAFLSRKQLEAHGNALNAKGVEPNRYLSYEWEVAVLNAFSKLGRVCHEADFGGVSRPDLHFSQVDEAAVVAHIRAISPDVSREVDRVLVEAADTVDQEDEAEKFAFIADIATVSDEGLRDRNPVEVFVQEFTRILKKNDLWHGFAYEIGSYSPREFAQHRTKTKLPPKNQLGPRIFQTTEFKEFIRGVLQSPSDARHIVFKDADVDLTITYDPARRGLGGGHPSYRSISKLDSAFKEIEHSGLYRALKSKAKQLRNCEFVGRRGIIVCDGGCQLLGDTSMMQTRTAHDVVERFLRKSSSVDFVLWVLLQWWSLPANRRAY